MKNILNIKKVFIFTTIIIGLALLFYISFILVKQNVTIFSSQNKNLLSNSKSYNINDMELTYKDNSNIVDYNLDITNDSNSFYINSKIVGDEIRVPLNTLLKVHVKNNSSYATSIHFHGLKGLSKMDGVGGITQENIDPNTSFTYEFYLNNPGTYMYHSHVNSKEQVNNEYLFGTLIVEDSNMQKSINKQSLIFNTSETLNTPRSIDVNGLNNLSLSFQENENINLSLVNMSSSAITLYFGDDIPYNITSVDATPVKSETIVNKELYIPTANRVDILIKNPTKNFNIQTTLDSYKNASIPINVNNLTVPKNILLEESSQADFSYFNKHNVTYLYNEIESIKSLNLKNKNIDKEYYMTLNMNMDGWAINNKTFPNTENISVNEGDVVQINLQAPNSMHTSPHPFHLHGHEFEVTKVNEKSIGKNLVMDTLEVLPGNSYTIRFVADNPGIWMFHCHDLNHADLGMMTKVIYDGYYFKGN